MVSAPRRSGVLTLDVPEGQAQLTAPNGVAATIASLNRDSAARNALSREISEPQTTSRLASTVVQNPSPTRSVL